MTVAADILILHLSLPGVIASFPQVLAHLCIKSVQVLLQLWEIMPLVEQQGACCVRICKPHFWALICSNDCPLKMPFGQKTRVTFSCLPAHSRSTFCWQYCLLQWITTADWLAAHWLAASRLNRAVKM